ncbi:MAG: hypothetical protein N2050_05750 [Flavobacteriales bacterium]|nr:hypothetical protein [Flavobacteriales bacterium]MCX7650040.1 hypothetical protein [Flavobacteriales bacterium]MDW8432348.1 hypothetical protein [Flavobacteriales bacterium]
MKFCPIFVLACTGLFSLSFLHAQNTTQNAAQRLPGGTPYREIKVADLPGYPTYKHTGNPQEDEKRYQQEKAAWIEKNPELYKKLNEPRPLTPEQEAEKQRKEKMTHSDPQPPK